MAKFPIFRTPDFNQTSVSNRLQTEFYMNLQCPTYQKKS